MNNMIHTQSRSRFGCVAENIKRKWRFAKQIQRFGKDEEGSMVILSLFVFMLLLVMGGIGIDLMRHEMERAHLHSVLDNAVLAGAAAPQGVTPQVIVEDYFAKSNMSEYLHEFQEGDIVSEVNATKVTASASMTLDTYLMKLSGIKTLSAAVGAAAERRVPKLEIVMVLDVSESMLQGSKIANLRTAAKDFVTTIMDASLPGSTVISIVPFSTSVTPSDGIYDVLAMEENHDYSNCVYLEENDYTHASLATGNSSLSTGHNLVQMIYTSMYGGFDDLEPASRSCYTDEYFRILPYSISKTQLNNKIDALVAAGDTSTEQGVKWGSALLGPRFREVSASLIVDGDIDASLGSVPVDYGTADTLKIMIVMGDGENTTTHHFDKSNPEYRGQHSDLHEFKMQDHVFDYGFYNKNKDRRYYDGSYESQCGGSFKCVYKTNSPEYSVYYLKDPTPADHNGDGTVDPYYNVSEQTWYDDAQIAAIKASASYIGGTADTDLDWEIAWGLMSPDYYKTITGDSGPWDDYINSEFITGDLKNSRMSDICTTLKGEGAFIYSVGFEVPDGGTAEANLKNCASSTGHYYAAAGLSITDAFSSIAANVQNLRLTQ